MRTEKLVKFTAHVMVRQTSPACPLYFDMLIQRLRYMHSPWCVVSRISPGCPLASERAESFMGLYETPCHG